MSEKHISVWVKGLQPGDKVAVFEQYGRIFLMGRVVERVSPSGRIYCEGGAIFKPDGYLFGSPTYSHRCIRPVPGAAI